MKFHSDTHMQRLTYERLNDTPSTMAAACGSLGLAQNKSKSLPGAKYETIDEECTTYSM